MYALMFELHEEDCILRLFNQSGQRAGVYQNWGPERQRSGAGQDNARTNLLEAILNVMAEEGDGERTQRAWTFVGLYSRRYPNLNRMDLMAQALNDKSTDIYTADTAIALNLMSDSCRAGDLEACVKFLMLLPRLRERSVTPDYGEICSITGCSRNNAILKQLYWEAANQFLTTISVEDFY
jgi:hypothetical protein